MQESPLNFFGSIGRAASSLFGGRSRRSKGRGRASMQGIGSIIGAKKESRGISLRDTLQRQTQQSNPSGIVEAAAGVTQPQSNFGLVNAAMSMQQSNLGLLPDQSITSQAANITGSNQSITGQAANIAGSMMRKKSNQGIANSAVSAVAQGTGLNTLTQGPSASSTTEALNAGDYRPMGVSQAFLMKSPLKQNHGGYPSTRTIKERVKAKQTNNPSDRNSSNSNLRKRVKASQNT